MPPATKMMDVNAIAAQVISSLTTHRQMAQIALFLKKYVPGFYIHFAPIGSDPDKRNYVVSNQRLREAGFEARRTLDDGIVELLKAYRMLGRGAMKNV